MRRIFDLLGEVVRLQFTVRLFTGAAYRQFCTGCRTAGTYCLIFCIFTAADCTCMEMLTVFCCPFSGYSVLTHGLACKRVIANQGTHCAVIIIDLCSLAVAGIGKMRRIFDLLGEVMFLQFTVRLFTNITNSLCSTCSRCSFNMISVFTKKFVCYSSFRDTISFQYHRTVITCII